MYHGDIKTDLHQQDLNLTPHGEAYGAQFLPVPIKPFKIIIMSIMCELSSVRFNMSQTRNKPSKVY